MKYRFCILTETERDIWIEIEALALRQALYYLSEYVVINHPNIIYLVSTYHVFNDRNMRSIRKLTVKSKDYFWTSFKNHNKQKDCF